MSSILRRLGIIKAETVEQKETTLAGVLEWDHTASPGMVYHTGTQLPFFKLILVRPYESAVFLRDGKIYAALPEGRWAIDKMPIVGRMEIIWVDLGLHKILYGLRTLTKDGIEIGANGAVYLKVLSPEKFVTNLVASHRQFDATDVQDYLSEQLSGVMRAEMATYDIRSLYIEREMFSSVARVKLDESLGTIGLEFQNLEVSGFLVPDEVKGALQAPFVAGLQAQATVLTGSATAEVLGKIKAAGVDPVKLKGAEALMKYAERPAGGGGAPFSGDFLMPLVFFGMLMKDDTISGDLKSQLKSMFPQFAEKTEPTSEPKKTGHTKSEQDAIAEDAQYSKKEIQRLLDNLDKRLAEGEISEAKYDELRKKWQKRLENT